ncbi:MAG TPA: hypothetical protein VF824_18135 [Thermoanaerobaculia bacterium]|jgi:hypothetical protein
MTTTPARLLSLFLATFALVPAAQATLSRAVSFDEKVDNAASIVLGRVVSQEARWDDARRWILTYSTFEIEKTFKGFPARQMTVVTPGGEVDGIHQETVGVPRFARGDERVLFIRNSQAGPTVLYFDQGNYEVVQEGSEKFVQPASSGAVLIDTQRGMAAAAESARPLRAFEAEVRDSLRKREAIRMEMVERQKREQASIMNVIARNRTLVFLALIGAALATWQLVKRW